MPRTARVTLAGVAQHIIQRGNNRQTTFTCEQDMIAYAGWLREYADKFEVYILAWVFMINHVHLLITPHSQKQHLTTHAIDWLDIIEVSIYV